jgi:2'-5' RNA ligase
VWVGVEGDRTALTELAGAVARACRDAGVDVERRPYRPHLTVGRRGRPDPARLAAYDGPPWTAGEVELVASRLGPTVEHRVLDRFPLTG